MIDLTQTPKRLKQSILMEAMQGKLTKQLPSDGDASDLLKKIANYQRDLVQNGRLKGYSKPLPPVKKSEEPFKIPDNWQWTRLSTVTPITLGKTPARHNTSYWNGRIPWVSIADLNDGVVSNTKEGITSKAACRVFHNDITPAGSLLMSFKLTIGKMGILKYPAYHNEAIVSFRFFVHKTNKVILRNYLYYTLPLLTTFVKSTSAIKGNTLNKSKLKKMLIPLPPLAEQKRIVHRLDQILPKIDGLNKDVVRLHSIRKAFPHRLKQSLLMEAMQGKLTKQLPSDGNADELLQKIQQKKQALIKQNGFRNRKALSPVNKKEIPFSIPNNWIWTKLYKIVIIRSGKRVPRGMKLSDRYIPGSEPYLRVKDMKNFSVNIDTLKFANKDIINKINKYRIYDNDIYITVAGTLGKIGTIPERLNGILLTENADRLIPLVNKYFVMYLLRSPLIKDQIYNLSHRVAQPKLSIKKLRNFIVPLPPLMEQNRIVNRLDSLFSFINR